MYFVYLLECKDKTLYCGITTDLKRRLEEHRNGTGAKYTRSRAGKIVYFERKRNRSTASKREAAIKKMTRSQKLQLIGRGSH